MSDFHGYESFFASHYVSLVRTLWSYCGDQGVAEEAAQEAFVRAGRDWRRVSRMTSPAGWLHRVAINEANRHFRRRAAFRRAAARHGVRDVPREAQAGIADRLAVRQALQRVPRRQRAALALHYFAGLPVAEIAQVLDAREGTVKSLLSRGRTALANQLRETEGVDDGR